MNFIELAFDYHELVDEMSPSIKEFINKLTREYSEEIERLNNIIEKIDEYISYKIIIESNAKGYQITLKDLTDIKKKLLELKR